MCVIEQQGCLCNEDICIVTSVSYIMHIAKLESGQLKDVECSPPGQSESVLRLLLPRHEGNALCGSRIGRTVEACTD